MKHTLKKQIQVNGKAVGEITLSEPTVATLRRLKKIATSANEIDTTLAMISALADLPVKALEGLHANDFAVLAEASAAMLQAATPNSAPAQPVPFAVLAAGHKFN